MRLCHAFLATAQHAFVHTAPCMCLPAACVCLPVSLHTSHVRAPPVWTGAFCARRQALGPSPPLVVCVRLRALGSQSPHFIGCTRVLRMLRPRTSGRGFVVAPGLARWCSPFFDLATAPLLSAPAPLLVLPVLVPNEATAHHAHSILVVAASRHCNAHASVRVTLGQASRGPLRRVTLSCRSRW